MFFTLLCVSCMHDKVMAWLEVKTCSASNKLPVVLQMITGQKILFSCSSRTWNKEYKKVYTVNLAL